jgi:hypothetical protein
MHEADSPFKIHVHAAFDEDGSWVVKGMLRYSEELSAAARELIAEDTERFLFNAIWLQAAKGRFELGAAVIRIHVDAGQTA